MENTHNSQDVKPTFTPNPLGEIDIDLTAWRSMADKLSLRETGELVRSLIRAKAAPRPNREQRMLLAIFTRLRGDEGEVVS
jgi:hypothetical protein